MRILQLGRFYPPSTGGIEHVMYTLTEGLNASGISCDVLCSNQEYVYQEENFDAYTVYRTKTLGIVFSTSMTPQMIFKLREIIRRYDIIHVHLPDPMANLALMLCNLDNVKLVLHWHSDIVKQKNLLKLYEPMQRWLLNKADAIIGTTPKYIQQSRYLQPYQDKCVSIPIGIDSDKLQANQQMVEQIKSSYRNKKIIFSLGRLVYYKGFEYLIRSASYLTDEYQIIIGGTGPLYDELKQLIDDEKLSTKVHLVGKINDDELGSYYRACDLFCLPSIFKSEAFGIVQIEAMSFGKPVVATRIEGSGVDWVNEDKISGLNVESKNSRALADAFLHICDDPQRYRDYCLQSKERFDTFFHADKMIGQTISLYQQIIKKGDSSA